MAGSSARRGFGGQHRADLAHVPVIGAAAPTDDPKLLAPLTQLAVASTQVDWTPVIELGMTLGRGVGPEAGDPLQRIATVGEDVGEVSWVPGRGRIPRANGSRGGAREAPI